MSDQNPWGTPPPSYGPPPGGPPPSGPPPGYGPPSGPPPGYGGYPPYGGYGGPPLQPPRKNTGLVVALVALGLVLVAGVALGAVLLLRGSGDDATDTVAPSTAPTTASASTDPSPSTSPSASPSTSPSASPSTSTGPDLPPSDSDTVKGTGYRYELPGNPGWTKVSKKDRTKIGPLFDSVIVFGSSFQTAQANILIERVASGTASVDDLEPSWQKGIEGSVDAKAQRVTAMKIDGEKAVAVRIKSVQGAGVSVQQVAYLTVHDGYSYTAAVSYQAGDDTSPEDDFDDVIGSWLWTS